MSDYILSLKEKLLNGLPDPLPPESECWLWQKGTHRGEYGRVLHAGHRWKTHRASLVVFTGETLTPGLEVAHLCHEKSCLNPKHLVQTTRSENQMMTVLDGKTKSRTLSDQQIRDIFTAEGRYEDIAERFGVTYSAVTPIKHLEHSTARHLLPDSAPSYKLARMLPPETIRQIYEAKGSQAAISRRFQVNRHTVYSIKRLTTECARKANPGGTPSVQRQTLSDSLIRAIYRATGPVTRIMALFGVSKAAVYAVKNLKTKPARRVILGEA